MYQMALSSFAVGETLGTGTFGRVRLVQCNYHGAAKTFALKMLKKTEIIRLKQVEHIKAEKAILSRISHPFIVNLYATFQDERCIYMIMEYIIGGELFSQLRKEGRFANDVARFYTAEIVLALEYLHAQVWSWSFCEYSSNWCACCPACRLFSDSLTVSLCYNQNLDMIVVVMWFRTWCTEI
jgi:serine/threonine protein kinase